MKFRKELVGSTTSTLVLSVLNTSPAHGYEIIRRVNELSNGVFMWQEGTLYPALHKLEDRELIEGQWVDAENGKTRRVYSLTENGKQALADATEEWAVYSRAVSGILEVSHA